MLDAMNAKQTPPAHISYPQLHGFFAFLWLRHRGLYAFQKAFVDDFRYMF